VLEDLEKASLSFLSISLEGTEVGIYGTTAVLTAESDIHISQGENKVHARVRLVAIYVARETARQLVHFQSTTLSSSTHEDAFAYLSGAPSPVPRTVAA